jgi:hypothetical protein
MLKSGNLLAFVYILHLANQELTDAIASGTLDLHQIPKDVHIKSLKWIKLRCTLMRKQLLQRKDSNNPAIQSLCKVELQLLKEMLLELDTLLEN